MKKIFSAPQKIFRNFFVPPGGGVFGVKIPFSRIQTCNYLRHSANSTNTLYIMLYIDNSYVIFDYIADHRQTPEDACLIVIIV